MKKIKQDGFTLIELMAVVAIIGVLAALALPMYGNYTGKAQVAEGLSLLKGFKSPMVAALSAGSISKCDVRESWFTGEVRSGKYVDNIAVAASQATKQCLITATFKSADVNDNVQGKQVNMRYSVESGLWSCGTNLSSDLVPADCRNPLLTFN